MLRLRVRRYLSAMLGRLVLAFPGGRSYVRARVVPLFFVCCVCHVSDSFLILIFFSVFVMDLGWTIHTGLDILYLMTALNLTFIDKSLRSSTISNTYNQSGSPLDPRLPLP